jgi:molybdopterin molybdotransferase
MKTLQSITSCLSDYDPDALPVATAQAVIRDLVEPLAVNETVPLRAALGRILAQAVHAPHDVPGADNAAMDGYAFDGAVLAAHDATSPIVLTCVGTSSAGHPYPGVVPAGACVRIMTGALIPAGCDTVVVQEQVQRETIPGAHADASTSADTKPIAIVRFDSAGLRAGANVRHAGEDLPKGTLALPAGRLVQAADLGLLASLGIPEVAVRRPVRVAFFSTGDELRSLGEPLEPGCVYDSNRYTLYGMLRRLGVEAIDLGVVRDEPAALEAALRTACAQADAVITTGGVSVGDADHTRALMARLGEVTFWKVAMRPGRPFAFGRLVVEDDASSAQAKSALFFGLPGNPVAVMISFYTFVRDALLALGGAQPQPAPVLRARAAVALRKRPGRSEFLRGIARREADGRWQVAPTGAQGSGVLSSMTQANCLIMLGHEQGDVAAGEPVDVMLFSGLI